MSDVVVLCYHAVSPDWPAQMSVTPERFEQQLKLLVGRGYRGATFAQAATAPPHRRTVAVTFDDGLRSVLERAFPLLERLGLPATVFVPTDLVGVDEPLSWRGVERWASGPYEDELRPARLGRAAAPSGRRLGDRLAHPHACAADDARRCGARRRARRVARAARGRARAAVPHDRVPVRRGRRARDRRGRRGGLRRRPAGCRRASGAPRRWRGRGPVSGTATARRASG